MEIEQLPLEVKKCFMKELEQLVSKYSPLSNYSEEQINTALSLLEQFGKAELELEELLEIIELINQSNEQVVQYYLWNREHYNTISIETAQEHIEEIHREGFIILDEYLFYLDGTNQVMKRALIEQMLTEPYDIDRLFDKDELIEMWLNETSQEDVIRDLMRLGLEELLEEAPEKAYVNCDGTSIYYANIEG
nr:hypothetical protein [uncultured Cellulosilyticum sp.]